MDSEGKVDCGPISEAPPASVAVSLSHANPQQQKQHQFPLQTQHSFFGQQLFASPSFYPQCYSSSNGVQQQQMPKTMQQPPNQQASTNSRTKTYIIVDVVVGIIFGIVFIVFMAWYF